ncbi:nucleotidyltransferase family protein [Mucilaginibacter sp. BT774]|uniref:nucleotidyltransferase family protein n=1 Tax=Mucilaginibacter sp. BT774 TaxID=3062276 RepID=UPI00267605F2|nr:nucleotidyltransferase family protein [Mucilaginibacter sp. BT774]MDO3627835.1 nucleotidyltransferase family protein [Mucilaginibacter sp. BT774]
MTSEFNVIKNCAAIILAAGRSSRLGMPKQLLKYQNKNLFQHTIDVAKQSPAQPIIVVLGSNADTILKEIDTSGIYVVKNDDWQSGLASTIRSGIQALQTLDSNIDSAILMVCDQPYVTPDLLNSLQDKQKKTGKRIIASQYGQTIGTPALFHKQFFSQLMNLKGDTGAKKIMMQNTDLLATISFPQGSIDIDTIDDYKALEE